MKRLIIAVFVFALFLSCERGIENTEESVDLNSGNDTEQEVVDDNVETPDEAGTQDTFEEEVDEDNYQPPVAAVSGFYAGTNWGDIPVSFTLDTLDGLPRNLEFFYKGACTDEWTKAILDDEYSEFQPGEHNVTWYSWETEAGCEGDVTFKITTGPDPEFISEPFSLANINERSGFVVLPQTTQGISGKEIEYFDEAVEDALSNDGTAFIATRKDDQYIVHGHDGHIIFERKNTNNGYVYEVVEQEGINPIGNQDYNVYSTYAEELDQGSNPMNSNYAEDYNSYSDGDKRLSFIEEMDVYYPFGYERIAAYFDHPDAADFIINKKSYVHYDDKYFGTHGSLSMLQSRSPLIAWGKGINQGVISEEPFRQVDIAPTIGKLLNMPYVDGVDERGIYSHFNYLKWQDGHAHDEILNGEAAKHVFIIIADGLNKTEFDRLISENPSDFPTLNMMKAQGSYAKYGSTTNWPSNTYPSHNTVGSGVYSGHHGIVDNAYWLRGEQSKADPITETVNTEKYFNPVKENMVESMHMALKRAFGEWNEGSQDGAYTMSVFDPSTVGSDTSDLSLRDRSGKIINFATIVPVADISVIPTVSALESLSVFGAQQTELISMRQIEILYESGPNPRPIYSIVNFMATDSCGHERGPHGDLMKPTLKHIDRNLALLLKWLGQWGIKNDTAIFFTSDHGMQIGDPQRAEHPISSIKSDSFSRTESTGAMSYYFAE